MYQFFVQPHQIQGKEIVILGNDVNHIKNVLRMKEGDELSVRDGRSGREYRCAVRTLGEDRIYCELRFVKEEGVELPSRVYLFQGLPKGDKMEFIVQKAVELGAYEIVPMAAKRCVVKLDEKKAQAKCLRWQGIAEAAAKQSRRAVLPAVHPVVTFERALELARELDVKLIPYELAEDMSRTRELIGGLRPGRSVGVFIGPEGGFEEDEIRRAEAAGAVSVTLGKRILRTETAGMTVLSWILYQLEE